MQTLDYKKNYIYRRLDYHTAADSVSDWRVQKNCSLKPIEPKDLMDPELQTLQWTVYQVIFPFLVTLGVVTNIIDLIVLSRPAMKKAMAFK